MSGIGAILLSTGFTVDRDEPSGLSRLADELRRVMPQGTYVYQGEHHEDWAEIARSPVVQSAAWLAFVGHSLGGGEAGPKFCRGYAPKRVALYCVIDGVPPPWTNPIKALWGVIRDRAIGTLKLPANVDWCIYWRQTAGAPYGRPVNRVLRAEIPLSAIESTAAFRVPVTGIVQGTVYATDSRRARLKPWESLVLGGLYIDHNAIDDLPAVHNSIVEEVLRLAG